MSSITQSSWKWLDLSNYDDIVLYLDVRELTGSMGVLMAYETAPTQSGADFTSLFAPFTMAVNSSPRVDRVLAGFVATPAARFLRWTVSVPDAFGGLWDVTFRILIAMHSSGM